MTNHREALEHQFSNRGVVRGGELYLHPSTGLEFVKAASRMGLAVIGIEGFEVEGDSVRPRLDIILDCSDAEKLTWTNTVDRCQKAAMEMLQALDEKVAVVVEVVKEEEWSNAG